MTVIEDLLHAFERGDEAKMDALATNDLDLRIEHYRDERDISWQRSTDRAGFRALLERLAREIFPRGTRILSLETLELGDGWSLTAFRQQFYYPARSKEVIGQTWIVAHELDGQCDYFREIAMPVKDVDASRQQAISCSIG
jgi:ketosteroid isomerase-like protein